MSDRSRSKAPAGWRAVFGAPLAVGLISLAGLMMALTAADETVRALSLLMIGLPVLVCLRSAFTSRR